MGDGLVVSGCGDVDSTVTCSTATSTHVGGSEVRDGSLAATPDGSIVGWLGSDGRPHVVEARRQPRAHAAAGRGRRQPRRPDQRRSTCQEGEGGNGCAAFVNSVDGTQAWSAISHGIVDTVPGVISIGDVAHGRRHDRHDVGRRRGLVLGHVRGLEAQADLGDLRLHPVRLLALGRADPGRSGVPRRLRPGHRRRARPRRRGARRVAQPWPSRDPAHHLGGRRPRAGDRLRGRAVGGAPAGRRRLRRDRRAAGAGPRTVRVRSCCRRADGVRRGRSSSSRRPARRVVRRHGSRRSRAAARPPRAG